MARTTNAVGFKRPYEAVLFDLTRVTAIDDVSKEFLAQAHSNGDRLTGGVVTSAVIDEIVARSGIKYCAEVKSGDVRDGLSGRVPAGYRLLKSKGMLRGPR